MFGRKVALPVFTIVDADPRDPLAALRAQEAAVASVAMHDANEDRSPIDWQTLLHEHLHDAIHPVRETLPLGSYFEDTSWRLDSEMIARFREEVMGLIDNPNVKWIQFDEDGNVVED